MNAWLQLVAANILVASLLGCLAWQVGRSGRRATLAHLLWVAFFVKLITPPIVLLPISVPEAWLSATSASIANAFPYRGLSTRSGPNVPSLLGGAQEHARAYTTSDFNSSTGFLTPSLDLWSCLGLVWFTGFGFVLVRGLLRFVRFRRLLVREGKQDDDGSAFVRQLIDSNEPGWTAQLSSSYKPEARASESLPSNTLARASGLYKWPFLKKWRCPTRGKKSSFSPKVLRIPIRVSPMLFGFGFRPAIVCPDQLWRSLSESDRQAFLAHETAHYCRRDHWVRWLEWIVTAAYWWFPGVYIARRQLERNEEACCDSWAVRQLGSSPRQYAEALLRVVDFISEHRVGLPRLASGMQPTESLEERLRLVMQGSSVEPSSPAIQWGASVACVSLWLFHPVPLAKKPLVVDVAGSRQPKEFTSIDTADSTGLRSPTSARSTLPEPPKGFWNEAPEPQWASFSLALPNARLVAESSRGVSIEISGKESLRFSSDDLSAVVEIPSTQRVVIGDRAGQLRLWDLDAGMPVSLIGRHAGGVTSVTYHESSGLVSADDGGSVMRWDLQSGQVLATWSAAAASRIIVSPIESPAIQSVRFSADGTLLAILTGTWNQVDARQQLHLVESRTLTSVNSIEVVPGTAVILPSQKFGWIAIDWSGAVRSIETQAMIATIEKHQVSALALLHRPSQLAALPILN